ncbi:MAG: AMP-binding protein, partial [Gemmatimonadota bacterium]|nr:AMP-binding protein [Gemmatimonadota bacterium]
VSVEANLDAGLVADLLALWRMGGVAAPTYSRLTPPERARQNALARPKWRLTDGAARPGEGSVEEPRLLCSVRSPTEALRVPVDSGLAALLTTSGSSGEPRCVAISHRALEASARAAGERLGLARKDCWGLLLSPAHAGGLSTIMRVLTLGSSLRCWGGREAGTPFPEVVRSVIAGDLSHLSVVPALVVPFLDALPSPPPPTFRCLLVGGAALSTPFRSRAAEAGVPLALTWGMTETGGQIATAAPETVAAVGATVGRPLRGMDVRVGRGGELSVRGPFLADGWITEPGGDLRPLPLEPGGWYRTPDLGALDGEGRLRIHGRSDDVIISGGVNVDPREVEEVLLTHPGVREAAVLGVPHDRWGEVVVAAVVTGEEGLDVDALHAECRAHLTRSKCPTHIVLLPELPRTATGKVSRGRLAEILTRSNGPAQ